MVTCRKCGIKHPDKKAKLISWECSKCVMKNLLDAEAGGLRAEKKTQKAVAVVKTPKVKKLRGRPGWPQGWHRKKHFVSPEGIVYVRGKPVGV